MILNNFQVKPLYTYIIDVNVEFTVNYCSLGSSEFLDEMPDVVYNHIDDRLNELLIDRYPNIHQHMTHHNTDVVYDFAETYGSVDMMWAVYSYSAEVTMILDLNNNNLLNYYKIKCPDEINRSDN